MTININLTPAEQTILTSVVAVLSPTDTVDSYLTRVLEKFVRGTILVQELRAQREQNTSTLASAFERANDATKTAVEQALGINIPRTPGSITGR